MLGMIVHKTSMQHQGTCQQSLVDCIDQTFIIAYKEPTEQLTRSLTDAGCRCTVLRQVHQPGYETYSPSFLCLLNHRSAWELALRAEKPTLIVEADFVPVESFAKLPPPFDPTDKNVGIAWLYTCAAQAYSVIEKDNGSFAQGYSTSMVAYVVTAKSARLLIELAAQVEKEPGPRAYSPWDSGIEYYLRDRGFYNYVPFRNYGEHGGLPNPEHGRNQLSKAHRADVLYGKLAFAPMYACKNGAVNRWDWLKGRAYGRVKGIGRVLLLKYLRGEVVRKSERGIRLIRWAIARHFPFIKG